MRSTEVPPRCLVVAGRLLPCLCVTLVPDPQVLFKCSCREHLSTLSGQGTVRLCHPELGFTRERVGEAKDHTKVWNLSISVGFPDRRSEGAARRVREESCDVRGGRLRFEDHVEPIFGCDLRHWASSLRKLTDCPRKWRSQGIAAQRCGPVILSVGALTRAPRRPCPV